MKPKYKAYVYLNAKLNGKTPALETHESDDKDKVLNYVRVLHSTGLILAYRLIYKPDETSIDWYLGEEVVFVPEGTKFIGNFHGLKE